jgi:hypothetical protein
MTSTLQHNMATITEHNVFFLKVALLANADEHGQKSNSSRDYIYDEFG